MAYSSVITTAHHTTVNVTPGERFASAVLGGLLLYSAFKGRAPLLKGAAASYLFYRAISGHCPAYAALGKQVISPPQNINIRTAITVNKPGSEVYAFWRKLENLPVFMKHLESVVQTDATYSVWKAKLPGFPAGISWKAAIVKEETDTMLSWDSMSDADVGNAGKIEFMDAGANGTEIHAYITYRAPLGKAGEQIAKLFNPAFETMIAEDLRNFRRYIETGEIPTIEGQPYGSKHHKLLPSLMN